MKLVRTALFVLAVGTAPLTLLACSGSVEQPQTSASAATKAPIGQSTHGLVKAVGDALGEVPLRPDQRTEIEKLAKDAEARHAPMAEGHKDLMLAVADQIERGAIDRPALQPKIDRITADFTKSRDADRAAFARLHAILDPEQRGLFVDALEKHMHAARGEHKGSHLGGEHHKGGGGPGGFLALQNLADELKLTDEQRTKIHETMRESFKEQMQAHRAKAAETGPAREGEPQIKAHHGGHGRGGPHGGKKVLEAFRQDKLDLDQIAPPHDAKAGVQGASERGIGVAEKVLPILTPEQRKIAADKIRGMAARGEAW